VRTAACPPPVRAEQVPSPLSTNGRTRSPVLIFVSFLAAIVAGGRREHLSIAAHRFRRGSQNRTEKTQQMIQNSLPLGSRGTDPQRTLSSLHVHPFLYQRAQSRSGSRLAGTAGGHCWSDHYPGLPRLPLCGTEVGTSWTTDRRPTTPLARLPSARCDHRGVHGSDSSQVVAKIPHDTERRADKTRSPGRRRNHVRSLGHLLGSARTVEAVPL